MHLGASFLLLPPLTHRATFLVNPTSYKVIKILPLSPITPILYYYFFKVIKEQNPAAHLLQHRAVTEFV